MSVISVGSGNRLVRAAALAGAYGVQTLPSSCFTSFGAATRFRFVGQTQTRCKDQDQSYAIVCGTKAGKNKAAKKKIDKPDRGGRDFDRLMLVWDDAFEKCCEIPSRAALLKSIAKEGLERYGRGCVLVTESVRTLARGSGSGFTNKFRPESDDVPAYTSLDWIAEFVPRKFIEDPTAFSDETTSQLQPGSENFPLVTQINWLAAVKRMMDRTRLLSLTCGGEIDASNISSQDAGGEAPCNSEEGEFVLVLYIVIDGNPTIGADVVTEDRHAAIGRCRLTMRDLGNL